MIWISLLAGSFTGWIISRILVSRQKRQDWDMILEPITHQPSADEYYWTMKELSRG